MFKNKSESGKNNVCGDKIRQYRKDNLKLSQKELADQLQIAGLDLDKNAIQRIESGQRFVTDIELCVFCRFFHIRADVLLGLEEWEEKI